MVTTSIRLPSALRQIPPLPRVLSRALALVQDPDSERSELVRVLSLDPGLTGCFLRMVNSAYYGLPRRISSLNEALGYLGSETVQSVIYAASSSKVLVSPVPAYSLQPGVLWQHSVAVAAGSEWIARQRRINPSADAYVSGLLHDVGKLVMDLLVQHEERWTAPAAESPTERNWLDMERQDTGHDHAEVGAIVVRSWNLADRVVEAVACHHKPSQAEIDPRCAAAVHIANVTALQAGIGVGIDSAYHTLEAEALEILSWSDRDTASLTEVMQSALAAAQQTLDMQVHQAQPEPARGTWGSRIKL